MASSSSFWPNWAEQPVYTVLLTLLLVVGVLWGAAQAWQGMQEARRVGYGEQMSPSIAVNASAKAVIKNDIANVDIGVTKNATTASEAQAQATELMNTLVSAMKTLGVSEDDLRTSSYTVNPQYDYERSPATIVGYEARQTLSVKIRDNTLVNAVLGKAGELGATDMGSLYFEADDDTTAENEARAEAIAEARAQAESIARAMGAQLGDVVSYSESRNDGGYPYRALYAESAADSMITKGIAPDVQMGQSEVEMYVYITYGLR